MTMDRDGIEIPRDVADAQRLPDELNANLVTEFTVPDPARRATAAKVYVVGVAMTVVGGMAGLGAGMWWVAGLLAVLAAVHAASAWSLKVREAEALVTAGRALGFPVGHASAAVRFRGPRARPEWNVILYDADEPPSKRALVFVDAVTGEVRGEPFVEEL